MKKPFAAAAVAVALLAAGTAYAGARSTYLVTIGSTYAYGGLGSARNTTADAIEYIGCYTIGTLTGTGSTLWGYCEARDRNNTYRSCQVTHPGMVSLMSSLKGDSMMYFSWDASGKCSYMYIYNRSDMEPKAP